VKSTDVRAYHIAWSCAVILAGLLSCRHVAASDAMLLEKTIDIQTGLGLRNFPSKTLYRSKKDPDQFYYLPANIRLALDKEYRPMLTVYKYNLVYSNGNFQDLQENVALGEVYQGGTLKATFTMGLRQNELTTLESAIKAKGLSARPKVGRLPLTKAAFSVALTDPENPGGAKMLLGPFPAPVSAGVIAVQEPLSRSATDIFYTILTRKGEDGKTVAVPDAPINILMNCEYAGYGLDATVEVKGTWDNVYKAAQDRYDARAGYWFVDKSASYERQKSELKQAANIEITYDGDVPEEMRRDYDNRVMDQILEQAFDLGGLEPTDADNLDDAAGRARSPDGQVLFGRPVGVSVGYARKAVSRQKTGNIQIKTKLLSRVSKEDARYAVLDVQGLDPQRNVMVVEPRDWSVARVRAEISEDVAPWFVMTKPNGERLPQFVSMTYGTSVSRQTFPKPIVPGSGIVDFGPFPNGGQPKVEVKWNLAFAPWPAIKKALAIEQNMVAASYSQVQQAMMKYYAGSAGPAHTMQGDLRLTSAISLTSAALPLKPEPLILSPSLIGPSEGGFNWYDPGNTVVLVVEQEYELKNGSRQKFTAPLGPIKMGTGPVAVPMAPLQAIILKGEKAKTAKLKAQAIVIAKEDGRRVIKQNVVLADDIQSGSPTIILDDILLN
jgi:hypothetical protein